MYYFKMFDFKHIIKSEGWNLLTEASASSLLLNPARPLARFLRREKLLPVPNLTLSDLAKPY